MLKLLTSLAGFVMLAGAASAQTVPPDIVKALAPQGTLRAAINFGNPVLAQKDAATGEPRGISVDLVLYDAAGKVADAAGTEAWDIAFLAIDSGRANDIAFTAPYVVIEGTYLVPADSPLRTIEDVDRAGVRVVVGNKSAYDLYLTRALKKAQLVRAPTSPAVIDVFKAETLEVAAGVRQQLIEFASTRPEVRVMDGRFMVIEQAMGTPKGREAGAAYLRSFVEEMKASGFAAAALAQQPEGRGGRAAGRTLSGSRDRRPATRPDPGPSRRSGPKRVAAGPAPAGAATGASSPPPVGPETAPRAVSARLAPACPDFPRRSAA